MNFGTEIAELKHGYKMLQSQAITESYFSSNDEIIELKANMINPLAHFCVDGGTVIEIFI